MDLNEKIQTFEDNIKGLNQSEKMHFDMLKLYSKRISSNKADI